jgi:cytochrome b involved in lipid metabolism
MAQHPGGADLIFKLLGRRIDEDFEEAEHTKSARNIFKELKIIGKVETAENSKKQKTFEGMGGLSSSVSERLNFDYSKGIIY